MAMGVTMRRWALSVVLSALLTGPGVAGAAGDRRSGAAADPVDVATLRSALEQAQAQRASLERQLARSRTALQHALEWARALEQEVATLRAQAAGEGFSRYALERYREHANQ